jgi:hypothetical protein
MKPFFNEAEVEIADGEVLHLVLNFMVIDRIESLTGQSMDQVLPQLISPPHNLATKILWAMLRVRHEDVTLDEAMGVVVDRKYGPKVGLVMADLLKRSYDFEEAKGKNPPKRRGRSQSSEGNG